MLACLVLGRKASTLKKLWLNPRMAPLSRLNVSRHVIGVFRISWVMYRLMSTPMREDIDCRMAVRAFEMSAAHSASDCGFSPFSLVPGAAGRRCPMGQRTTMASLPAGAAEGSIREGTLT